MIVNQDSRTIKKGEWFVAVKGEKFDGHEFITEALRRGAAGVLEISELYNLARKKLAEVKPEVIAVTGSYGKTTTKEAIYRVLSRKYEVLRTQGNLNTPLGVAMEVVNNLKPRHRVLVAEVGMDRLGEIAESCEILHPSLGIVTSVGEMHLEKLGTLANIRRAKSELLRALPVNGGVAVLNADDHNVRKIAKSFGGQKVWFGFSRGADVGPEELKGADLKLLGKANISNVIAAFAVGWTLRIPRQETLAALSSIKPQNGRLSLISNGKIKIIDDSYNSGPRSVALALEVLSGTPAKRKIAILGDMLELGHLEEVAHIRVACQVAKIADVFVPVGERMNRAVLKAGTRFTPLDALVIEPGDVVLIKGSRGMRMERFVDSIRRSRSDRIQMKRFKFY